MATGPEHIQARLDKGLDDVRRFLHRGELKAAERGLDELASMAERAGSDLYLARALTLRGCLLEELGDFDAALDHFGRADELLESSAAVEKAEAVAGIARCCHTTGKGMYAIQLLEGYLVKLESEGTFVPSASMRIHSTLVLCYQALGMMRQASTAAEKALKHSAHVDDPEQVACMKINVARVLLDQGRYPEAVDAIEDAERIYTELDWHVSAARAKSKRGIIEAERGNLEQARAALEEALSDLGPAGVTKIDRAYVLDELGRVERLRDNHRVAIELLHEARGLLDDRDLVELGMNARELGLCMTADDPQGAAAELEKALGYYQAAGASAQVATTMLYLGRILKEQGKLESALDVFSLPLESGRPKSD